MYIALNDNMFLHPRVFLGPRVFVIHAGEDKDSFVRPLVINLLQQGLAETDIFFDYSSIKPGDNIRERILSALSSQTLELAVVVVSSSLLNKHYWPKFEYETCLRKRKRIFPIWFDANNDNFKAFSEQVGEYSPTLKQLVARRVQRDNVPAELPGIAAEIIQQLSPLESGVSDPAGSHVPIDLQGPEMTELYVKACREGSLPVHNTRAQVVGQYRSGKTCFINRLMGEPVRLDEPITDGINITPDVQTKAWKQSRVEIDEFGAGMAGLLLQSRQETETSAGDTESPSEDESYESVVTTSSLMPREEKSTESPATTSSDDTTHRLGESEKLQDTAEASFRPSAIPSSVSETLKRMRDAGFSEEDLGTAEYPRLSFWDFGGQATYYGTHHCFITHLGIYILVMSLLQKLSDPVPKQDHKASVDNLKTGGGTY
ncbi:uncharacterized protein LOC118413721 [Branchiostoma floridae]|uniref:Uncharacterized protein LOC118413721 n=1 Tax=Branchiostoma floridae TaxID=7739 RepID=A0A9J7MMB3_BRAFL|nr:uncharacterized protein LOC118413721 [Branchiostoma floridae]